MCQDAPVSDTHHQVPNRATQIQPVIREPFRGVLLETPPKTQWPVVNLNQRQILSVSTDTKALDQVLAVSTGKYINRTTNLSLLLNTQDIMLWGEPLSYAWMARPFQVPASATLRIAVRRSLATTLVEAIINGGGCEFVPDGTQQESVLATLEAISGRATANSGHCLGVLSFRNLQHDRRVSVQIMSGLVYQAIFMAQTS
jgi:hypothetical protein